MCVYMTCSSVYTVSVTLGAKSDNLTLHSLSSLLRSHQVPHFLIPTSVVTPECLCLPRYVFINHYTHICVQSCVSVKERGSRLSWIFVTVVSALLVWSQVEHQRLWQRLSPLVPRGLFADLDSDFVLYVFQLDPVDRYNLSFLHEFLFVWVVGCFYPVQLSCVLCYLVRGLPVSSLLTSCFIPHNLILDFILYSQTLRYYYIYRLIYLRSFVYWEDVPS